jgi:hypothetical protein
MAFRHRRYPLIAVSLAFAAASPLARAQVFVVGEKSAMADVSTDFHPTRVELPSTPISERGRRELVRDLEAEQGFAHRALPLYKKGQSAGPGDRVAITTVTVKADRIVFDLNGGPYLKHRFLRHIQLDDAPVVANDGAQVTGCRVTLLFEGGIPDISAPEVKALLDPIIDFGVKTSGEAYADSLPEFLKDAIQHHDVLAAMGAPISKERELLPGSNDKHYEEWIYGQVPQTVHFVRFVGDRVIQVRTAALGQAIAVRDENEMHGYLDPEDTREIAMGDGKPGSGDSGATKPPSILKPGEVAPGSSQQVRLPVSAPTATRGTTTQGTTGADPAAAPSTGPATPTGSTTGPPSASTP